MINIPLKLASLTIYDDQTVWTYQWYKIPTNSMCLLITKYLTWFQLFLPFVVNRNNIQDSMRIMFN